MVFSWRLTSHSPYYIWLGRPRACDVTRFCHAFEVEGGNTIGNCSPVPFKIAKEAESVPPLDIGDPFADVSSHKIKAENVINITAPLSSFHYQVKNVSSLTLMT